MRIILHHRFSKSYSNIDLTVPNYCSTLYVDYGGKEIVKVESKIRCTNETIDSIIEIFIKLRNKMI